MARFFTLSQAQGLLRDVEPSIRDAIHLKTEFEDAESELQAVNHRIVMLGGSVVNRESIMAQKARRESSATRLQEVIENIQACGCQIKDLDTGLIDFPTLYRGEEVLLCWKLGEEGIAFWHELAAGFGGRRKIDQEFLDNHHGDLTH